nr:ORF86 [Acipenserid herpesvirus 1]
MPGYPQSVVGFQSGVLLCSECNLLLKDPYLAFCGHRHCFSCKADKCAQCFQNKADSIPDTQLKLTIEDLWATCPNCKWAGNVARYNQHTCSKIYAKEIKILNTPAEPQTELESLKRQLLETTELVKTLQKQLKNPPNYTGKLIWKISNWSSHAKSGAPLTSEPFYTGHYGYKLCVRLYPRGDGNYKDTHLSVFIALMPHDWDPILPWPFRMMVNLIVINQNRKNDICHTFQPDPLASSFQRPITTRGLASGNPHLCRLEDLNSDFVVNDTIFVKVVVS